MVFIHGGNFDHMFAGALVFNGENIALKGNVIVVKRQESRSCGVYSIQHYEIKFVSELWQVGGFLREIRFPPPIKLTATI
jgi:hypothetical protein